MNALMKVSADQMPNDRINDIIDRLKARNVPIALILDVDLAVIQAQAAGGQRPRKPLHGAPKKRLVFPRCFPHEKTT